MSLLTVKTSRPWLRPWFFTSVHSNFQGTQPSELLSLWPGYSLWVRHQPGSLNLVWTGKAWPLWVTSKISLEIFQPPLSKVYCLAHLSFLKLSIYMSFATQLFSLLINCTITYSDNFLKFFSYLTRFPLHSIFQSLSRGYHEPSITSIVT